MSLTREDLLAHAKLSNDLDSFLYWDSPVAPASKPTVTEMLHEYRKAAEQGTDVKRGLRVFQEECEEAIDEVSMQFAFQLNPHGYIDNRLDLIKEVADVIYTAYGLLLDLNVDAHELVSRVHQNNMNRMYQDDGTIKRNKDGKVMKNPNADAIDLKDLL